MTESETLQQARTALADARRVLVFTGAGVSAESGVPTFRDALTGLWAQYDPMQLATPEAFVRDPALVWGWYEWRRKLLLAAQPNPAHLAIARLQQQVPELLVVTQNVDDLHEQAGSQQVLHLHGSLFAARCFDCAKPFAFELPPAEQPERQQPPACQSCGGMVRPGVVWFGESLPEQALQQAFAAAEHCDLLLAIGTSGVVQPAAQLPHVALQAGATVVHINPDVGISRHSRELCLAGKAGELLPQLVAGQS